MSQSTLSDLLGRAARDYIGVADIIEKSANLLVETLNEISCFREASKVGSIGKDKNAVAEIYYNGNVNEDVSGWFKTSFYGDGTMKTIHSTRSPAGGAELVQSQSWDFSRFGYNEPEIVEKALLQAASIDHEGFGAYLKAHAQEGLGNLGQGQMEHIIR